MAHCSSPHPCTPQNLFPILALCISLFVCQYSDPLQDSRMNRTMKLLLLVLLIFHLITGLGVAELLPTNASSTGEFRPVETTEYQLIVANTKSTAVRRRLAPFQLCFLCKCCATAATATCATMPCCFGIDCQLPNKPYGVCAFVPKTCNCTSCAV